jgi:hypothetical protein
VRQALSQTNIPLRCAVIGWFALCLLAAQAIGQLHRVAHAPQVSAPIAAMVAHDCEHHGEHAHVNFAALFHHDAGSPECPVFDALYSADASIAADVGLRFSPPFFEHALLPAPVRVGDTPLSAWARGPPYFS